MPLNRKIEKGDSDSVFLIATWVFAAINAAIFITSGSSWQIKVLLVMNMVLFFLFFQWRRFRTGNGILCQTNKKVSFEDATFLEKIPTPIFFLVCNKITYVNNAGMVFLGVERKENLIDRSLDDFICRNEEDDDGNSMIVLPDKRQIECKIVNAQGEYLDVEIVYTHMSFEKKNGYLLVMKDLTELKDNQKRLEHSEQLNILGELAAGIAHEIRNPLTSLKGFLQLSESRDERYTRIMLSEIERINLIVNELLLIAKPKDMMFESKPLLPIIETVVTIANTQAIIHNIVIQTHIDEEAQEAVIWCEENKLKQVFLNILKNGIEAMSGEGTIYLKIWKEKNSVHLSFKDEGVGISETDLANLGKRFYSTKRNGTGLGLMLSFRMIEEHGGEMNIHSEVGKGTEVEIILPL
ncbi:ATP-binding protein [Halalkalibacterium ligniniphilum]|uniref:ATP-binding protein n=1 Tax=Halalkalibacterium ligniniphilum TaxID=1134413 RepID=UPI00034A8733|nr:ATP-binding protein [Halalkalibacterium ligniniphilum]